MRFWLSLFWSLNYFDNFMYYFLTQLEDECFLYESYQSDIIGKTKCKEDRKVISKVSVVHSD